ncbi:MAG: hypothetical protein B6D73_13820 [gamma proteobacterium symbiont of Stewartia floridana]|nr:MAG: hypothetical protein B6D73_13820 [gamma proteobacterium symbiont of Stewartia floridana]
MIKTILITASSTIAALALISSIFYNSMLGVFGLAVTSISTLETLQASHSLTEKIRANHKKKKKGLHKRFVKKSGKRVASGALAAATIGTTAVAITMTSFEIMNYCEKLEELQIEANILHGTAFQFDYSQCFEDASDETKSILTSLKNSSVAAVFEAMQATANYSSDKWAIVKSSSMQLINTTRGSASSLWDSSIEWLLK